MSPVDGVEDRSDYFSGPLVVSQCTLCRHRSDVGPSLACAAFPNRIPDEFLNNRVDHRAPHPDDQGVRFEPRTGVAPEALRMLYATLDRAAPDRRS